MATATTGRLAKSANQQTAQRNFIAEITTGDTKARPMAAVAYGPPGVGKTSLGAAVPGRIFLCDDKEDGISTLKANRLVDTDIPVLPPATCWIDVLEMLRQLIGTEYKALVVDALGGIERLCHEHVCRTQFAGEWGDRGFGGYQRGYEVSLSEWRLFLNALDALRTDGKSILLLGHSAVKPYKNPDGADYDRFTPDMHHKTWGMTHKWADMVLFMNYFVETTKDGGRTKGRGGQERIIYTEYHAAYEAKNRSGLPTEIDAGKSGKEAWTNLRNALKGGRE